MYTVAASKCSTLIGNCTKYSKQCSDTTSNSCYDAEIDNSQNRKEDEMHWPLLHWKWLKLQAEYSICLAKVNDHAWSHKTWTGLYMLYHNASTRWPGHVTCLTLQLQAMITTVQLPPRYSHTLISRFLIAYYHIQSHHCHQCSLQSHHSGERRGCMYHCCIEKLHFGRKLYKM